MNTFWDEIGWKMCCCSGLLTPTKEELDILLSVCWSQIHVFKWFLPLFPLWHQYCQWPVSGHLWNLVKFDIHLISNWLIFGLGRSQKEIISTLHLSSTMEKDLYFCLYFFDCQHRVHSIGSRIANDFHTHCQCRPNGGCKCIVTSRKWDFAVWCHYTTGTYIWGMGFHGGLWLCLCTTINKLIIETDW